MAVQTELEQQALQRQQTVQSPVYPVSAFGSLFDKATLPNHIRSGSSAWVSSVKNLLPLGADNLVAWGGSVSNYQTATAVRHGVTGASGGNIWNNPSWGSSAGGSIVTNRHGSSSAFAFNGNGEIVVKDTNAATAPANGMTATSYGGAYELFTVAQTVNAYASGASSITFSATIAADVLSTAYGYTPSLNNPRIGDVVRLTDNAGTSFSYHRLTGGGAATWNISPNAIFTTAGGQACKILRTGWGSYSKVVQIFNSTNNHWYDYYAGNFLTENTPGTIECAEVDGANNSAHYMCPQNSAAADIKAVDVAYYKGFLLYGYGSAISWSVAGFPTSFTFGFGATDFPAGNTTVVATDDYFVGFEYLGEQLIAIFRNSLWQVQATGVVPEFAFYKLPEQTGSITPSSLPAGRPMCSADGAIYYLAYCGLMELAGATAKQISNPFVQTLTNPSTFNLASGAVMWESFSDTIFFIGYPCKGLAYHRPTRFWSTFDCTWASAWTTGLTGANPSASSYSLQLLHYDPVTDAIVYTDDRAGGPANGGSTALSAPWSWGSPVVPLGELYGEVSGIQADINAASASYTMQINSGKTAVIAATTVRKSPPIVDISNRKGVLGPKIDDAFLSVIISGPSSTGSVMLGGVNLFFGSPQYR